MRKTLICAVLFGVCVNSQLLMAKQHTESNVVSQAKVHFDAIATADIYKLMGQYHSNATLHWVGGPLDGVYSGDSSLRTVWKKFTSALGPMKVKVKNIKENSNPKGSTITSDILFEGKKTIPVHYILTYRGNKLVNEVWQISPGIAAANY